MVEKQVLFQGTPQETSLWTNSNPTSAFSAQNITLSQSISDFTWIKVTYRFSTGDSRSWNIWGDVTSYKYLSSTLGLGLPSSGSYGRSIKYVTDTTQTISKASSDANNYTIPVAVFGVK